MIFDFDFESKLSSMIWKCTYGVYYFFIPVLQKQNPSMATILFIYLSNIFSVIDYKCAPNPPRAPKGFLCASHRE